MFWTTSSIAFVEIWIYLYFIQLTQNDMGAEFLYILTILSIVVEIQHNYNLSHFVECSAIPYTKRYTL